MNLPKLLQQAVAHLNAGNPGAADAVLKKILKKQPKHLDAMNLAGVAAYQLQDHARARTVLTRVVERDPARAGAHLNLGAVLNAMQQYAAAERHYRAALKLVPDNAVALNNLGKNFLDQNKLDDAAGSFEAALACDPDYWIARHNLGTVQRQRGDIDGSIASLQAALVQHPSADTLSELIGSLRRTQRFDEEYACAKQLLALPDAGDAAISAWETLFDACEWETIDATRAPVLGMLAAPDTRAAHRTAGLILLHSLADADPAVSYACHRAWADSLPRGKPRAVSTVPRDRIAIGYLSPDFRDHSVGFFIRHVIAAHDSARFEVHCYANHRERDTITDDIARDATAFTDISGLSDEEVAQKIAADGIDILIDLAGHTRDSRIALLAERLAPLQVTYLGYPNTSGLDTVDYRISDPHVDTPGGTQYSETLLCLPESFLCFGEFEEVPRERVPGRPFTFGSFNNIRKLNPQCIAAWSEVLRRVPDSRFVIKSRRAGEALTQRNLLALFAEQGISPERIDLLPPTASRSDHLAAYNSIDVVLDTFPYHGTTTTCEALWMGVPVVTLAGETHAQRVSYSILENTGFAHLATWNEADFVERAVALANDPAAARELGEAVAEGIRRSVLCDPARFTRQFEQVLADALADRAPETGIAAAG